ncbi:MAG: hypothetical protein LUB61_03200, partial [Eggerthellaceae bacterium]|nr:hypothetical protein [Eggerthellaceae bacterium]
SYITRDGELISQNGIVSMGRDESATEEGIIARAKKIDSLSSDLEKSKVDIEECSNRRQSADEDYERAQEQLLEIKQLHAAMKGNASFAK